MDEHELQSRDIVDLSDDENDSLSDSMFIDVNYEKYTWNMLLITDDKYYNLIFYKNIILEEKLQQILINFPYEIVNTVIDYLQLYFRTYPKLLRAWEWNKKDSEEYKIELITTNNKLKEYQENQIKYFLTEKYFI